MKSPDSPTPPTKRLVSTLSLEEEDRLKDINEYICRETPEGIGVSAKTSPTSSVQSQPRIYDRQISSSSTVTVDGLDCDNDTQGSSDSKDEDNTTSDLPTVIESDGEWNDPPQLLDEDEVFWLYGHQSKGPAGKKFNISVSADEINRHEPFQYHDPVFEAGTNSEVRHIGKARMGDGNDISPDPESLLILGEEIAKFNAMMKRTPGPGKANVNSKICRERNKAKLEANKIILDGLEKERYQYSEMILYLSKLGRFPTPSESCWTNYLKQKARIKPWVEVAGGRHQYVLDVLKSYRGHRRKALKTTQQSVSGNTPGLLY